jgi:hypothetical protein
MAKREKNSLRYWVELIPKLQKQVNFLISNGGSGTPGPQGPQGDKGDQGDPGINGTNGTNGTNGDSAYEVWLSNGNTGTIQDYLNSLKGDQGPPGNDGTQGPLPKYVSKKAGLTRPGQTTIPLANQSGNSNYEEYLKLEYPCTVTDNYQVSIAFQWSANTNNTNAKFRLVLSDGTVTNFKEVRIEAKDIGGAGQIVDVIENGVIVGQVDSNTDIVLQEYFPIDEFLQAGKTYSISLEFGHESAGSEVTVYSSTIRLEQKTQNP